MGAKQSSQPWILARNRVERFFVGGQTLDEWQGLTANKAYGDSTFSEELLVNTAPYMGPGRPALEGFSLTEEGGQTLKSLIDADPVGFLGASLALAYGSECPVLCKAGDSTGRLILQYHPTQAFARQHLACTFGKTEAWYFLQTRTPQARYCYVGFKPGVTRKAFERLVAKDDVAGMLDCIHRIPFAPGDVVLVPAGTIHAMGPDTTFIEVHEPCDYTMRFERDNYGRRMADDDMHYGLGFPALFDGLDFTPYTAEEIQRKVRFSPIDVEAGDDWKRQRLLSFQNCPEFSMERLVLHGDYALPVSDRYRIAIALRGKVRLSGLSLPQGRAAFLPAAMDPLILTSPAAEVLFVTPGLTEKKEESAL